ncbi:MAG: hypothetical protein QG621_281 [Patescibacteria group bacterium]|nr:hypothetical protein [Patescibacteria group bacterium]
MTAPEASTTPLFLPLTVAPEVRVVQRTPERPWYVLNTQQLLVALAYVLITLLSLILNLILLRKLAAYGKRTPTNLAHMRDDTKDKLMALKKDLKRHATLYAPTKTKSKKMSKDEAQYAEKMRTHIADVETYIDQKLKDIK